MAVTNRLKITEAIRERKVLVSDGAWGTMMQMRGLEAGESPENWNFNQSQKVYEIAAAYIAAGSDIIETNSFGGTVYKLSHFNLDGRVREVNKTAAELSRKAAGTEHFVMGSMGPTGKLLITGEVNSDDLYSAFKEQALALEKGGADALMIETQIDVDEAVQAARAGKENTGLEIIVSFTFEETENAGFRTMMGTTPAQAVQAAADAGADIIGANCGRGYENIEQVIKEFRGTCPDIPVLIQTNAGIPSQVDGRNVFPASPEEMAAQVPLWIDAGASIIGGCCGTTEKHIAAIRKAVDAYIE